MRVERYMVGDEKNKVVKEDPSGQNTSSLLSDECCNKNRRYASGMKERGNFKIISFSCSIWIQNESWRNISK